jgi:hypothetical protein
MIETMSNARWNTNGSVASRITDITATSAMNLSGFRGALGSAPKWSP